MRSFRNDWLCINHLGIQSSALLTVLAQTVPNEGPSHLTGFNIYRSWRNIINGPSVKLSACSDMPSRSSGTRLARRKPMR